MNEATKYTVLGVFAVYAIGFLVWRSFLGTYGISSAPVPQTEFLSASFCYLFFVTVFALPTALVVEGWLTRKKREARDSTLLLTLGLCSTLMFYLSFLLFPETQPSRLADYLLTSVGVVAVAHILLYVIIALKWPNSRLQKVLYRNLDGTAFYILAFPVFYQLYHPQLNARCLVFTMLLYPSVCFVSGGHIRTHWSSASFAGRVLLTTFAVLVFVVNINSFGSLQFRTIPRQYGGGKPERAFLRFSPQQADLTRALDISSTPSNGLFGPVAILLRSEKEIFFADDPDGKSLTRTNVVSRLTTNATTGPWSTGNVAVAGNETRVLGTNFGTNVGVVRTTNLVTNVQRITAKSVRADLVDAVLFTE